MPAHGAIRRATPLHLLCTYMSVGQRIGSCVSVRAIEATHIVTMAGHTIFSTAAPSNGSVSPLNGWNGALAIIAGGRVSGLEGGSIRQENLQVVDIKIEFLPEPNKEALGHLIQWRLAYNE